jgi:pimeloyl-ACP methyl ester carboxylesterase
MAGYVDLPSVRTWFADTIALYRAIPDSELAIVPGTSHFLIQEKPDLCNKIILEFLTIEPVPTIAPIRRA